MKYKQILIGAFILTCLAQLYIPAKMILNQETVLKHGKEFRFETAPVDPNDPFRGKYIMLRFKEDSYPISKKDSWNMEEDIYLHLQLTENGFVTISHISKTPPTDGTDYLKATVAYVSYEDGQNKVFFKYPFERFYMEESKAYKAELAYNASQQDTTQQTFALVNIKDGDAVLKDVLINGIPVKEVVERQRAR